MRALRWERYVPDVEDNRARHARGESALVVELRPPTARVWREFWGSVAEDEPRRQKLLDLVAKFGDEDGPGRALQLALWNDDLAGILWRGCVRAVEVPDGYIEGLSATIRDGADLWAAREVLDATSLYTDVLAALINRAVLDAGTVDFLASRSGRGVSPPTDASRDGIAASVATRA